ncbi:MAG: helix-turn-helix domain-containing protein [Bryobacteraceae bacterium]|jgi:hypothetical protein
MTSGEPYPVSSESLHSQGHERITSRAKTEAVLRVLKGETVERVSEDLGISVGRIQRWKNNFVEAGSAELVRRKHTSSKSWLARHSNSIWQWTLLLLVLVAVVSLLVVFMQRGPQDGASVPIRERAGSP